MGGCQGKRSIGNDGDDDSAPDTLRISVRVEDSASSAPAPARTAAKLMQGQTGRSRAGSSISTDVRVNDSVVVFVDGRNGAEDGDWYAGVVVSFTKGFTSFEVRMDDGSTIHAPRKKVKKPERKLRSALKKRTSVDNGGIGHSASFRNDYEVGQRVSCKISGWNRYYEGFVRKKAANGASYSVEFDDGETIEGVAPSEMKKIKDSGATAVIIPPWLDVGTRVEAKIPGWRQYYAGTVEFVDMRNGKVKILFDDGELTHALPSQLRKETKRKLERKPTDAALKLTVDGVVFAEGERVLANPENRYKRRYPATVVRNNQDGTYALLFEGGDRVGRVMAEEIESIDARLFPQGSASATSAPSTPSGFGVGDRVEAKIEGWRQWYEGEVKKVHADGSCIVLFDDGEVVPDCPASRLRPSRLATGDDDADDDIDDAGAVFSNNDRVLARLPQWSTFYLGTVTGVDDFAVAVAFDDGEVYDRVDVRCLKRVDPSVAPTQLTLGDRVEARILDWSTSYPGVVAELPEAGRVVVVDFDDGERHALLAAEAKPRTT